MLYGHNDDFWEKALDGDAVRAFPLRLGSPDKYEQKDACWDASIP